MKKITIIARDEDNKIKKLIEDMKSRGNGGHTFSVYVEPGKHQKAILWDGDGSDSISSVQVEDFFNKGELKDMMRAVTRYESRPKPMPVFAESKSQPDCTEANKCDTVEVRK